jgi:hypothetical protein
MKKRKFAKGGTPDNYAQAIAEGRNAVYDPEDSSGSYAKAMLGESSKPSKPRIVSKEELEKSGLSLRDFLNKERGLTRRKSEKDPTAGEAKDKAAQRAADLMGDEAPVKRFNDTSQRFPSKVEIPTQRFSDTSQRFPSEAEADYARITKSGRDAIENVYPESMLGGAGALRGVVGALTSRMAAKKAAQEAVEAGKAFSVPRTPEVAKSVEKYTPKQQMEAAESAMRGATNRAKIAAKKTEEKELPDKVLDILRDRGRSKIADTLGGGRATKTRGEEALEKIFNKRDADFKRGGKVKKYASGGSVSSASSRGDGIAQRGKTKGRMY